MLSVLFGGTIVVADPETRTGKNEKPYTTAKVAVVQEDGNRVLLSVIAFGSVSEQLARLRRGDDVSVAGRGTLNVWVEKATGEPRAGMRVVAHTLLTPYEIKARRKPAAPGAEQ